MKKTILFLSSFLLLPYIFYNILLADIGVGVGTGKIQVDEELRPGIIYQLPSLTVLNTGDQESNYTVGVSYHQDQEQLKPDKQWFSFSPKEFSLEPGKAQEVKIKLNLPLRTQPGDYFAYLEGMPLAKKDQGGTKIGVAAAAKLYFTIVPASLFHGIYYKIISFWQVYSPWPQRIVLLIIAFVVLKFFKKFFNIQVNLKKPPVTKKNNNERKKDE